ncbi:MAG TPA: squalene--hopene cyclase [Mycobacteriales bacterium]|nr:squalene--hopene cyclase [Mycobacteriales bacterium]
MPARTGPAAAGPARTTPAGNGLADNGVADSRLADSGVLSAAAALDRGAAHLLSQQDPAGWWKGELETNVTIEAEDLFLRHVLGISDPVLTEQTARWIRSKQRADGSWATFFGGPPELSTTVEAYAALRLAGDPADAAWMRTAARYIQGAGGLERTRVFTRVWFAMLGLWSWDELPALPPELIFLPRWMPLNVYDFGCWARQTVVPLTVVGTLRPSVPVPFELAELRTGARRPELEPRRGVPGLFQRLDVLLHRYARHPIRPLRRLAMRRAAEWIVARQESDGSWGGIQPPWVYSLLALHLLGYPRDHPVLRAGLAGLAGFTVLESTADGPVRRLEACQSPVWDTGLAVIALRDAGLPADAPELIRAADWLVAEEIRVPGDWSVRRPGLAPGGWAFEFANDGYPDTDDAAEVVLALRRVTGGAEGARRAAVERGVAWVIGMQSKDGGWGAFDADNTRRLAESLPFCDFGAVIDPPSADVTAHIVEMLAADGKADHPAARRGVAWLLRHQERDGSWFGRWGANHLYGTGAVLPALVAAGVAPGVAPIRRAVRWLERVQNPDGGWGEDLRSYRDPGWIGRGTSTASQTAWALLALLAAGERSAAVTRGVDWLVRTQRPDGSWDEPEFTGTGFPGDFYLNYHLYRQVFPVSALGRYLGRADQRAAG